MTKDTILPNQSKQLGALAAFAVLLAFCGGTSNPSPLQDVILRPLCALFLMAALYWSQHWWQRGEVAYGRAALAFLLVWAGWTLLQLVPLPPWAWQSLPDRALLAELDAVLGLEGTWRPISWVPTRGWNALAGMIVPLTAVTLAIAVRARGTVLLSLLLGVALIDASMNFLQLASSGQDTFYLYKPHPGKTDGLFSNENHSGVFSALGLLVAMRLFLMPKPGKQAWQNIAYGAAYLFLFLAVLVGGSRAALVAGLGALLSTGAALYLTLRTGRSPVARPVGAPSSAMLADMSADRTRWLLVAAGAALFAGLAGSFIWLERSPSFDGILSENTFEDLRWELAPILLEMIQKNWLFGIGFGAFEEYYHIYEPTALLLPLYINQAHNDWGQLILEGGLPAVAMALGLAGWIARKLLVLIKRGQASFPIVVFWLSILAIMAAASLIDYPIRTPIFQVAIVWMLVLLEDDERSPALQGGRFTTKVADQGSGSGRARGQRGDSKKTAGFKGAARGRFKQR